MTKGRGKKEQKCTLESFLSNSYDSRDIFTPRTLGISGNNYFTGLSYTLSPKILTESPQILGIY